MKIGTINSTAATTAVATDRKSPATTKDSTTSTVKVTQEDSSTTVELSPAAALLSQASADPSFDAAKVERIAQAIKDGKFTVDPGAIADKLLSNSQELLSRAQTSH
jgi:negative regulator of flagellin synthesis FlgM